MTYTIILEMDNAAFCAPNCGKEVAGVLRDLVNKLEPALTHLTLPVGMLHDTNGNFCGMVRREG